MLHNIFTKEITLILPNFQEQKRIERGIATSLVTCFIGLEYVKEYIAIYIKRQKTIQKAFEAMER